jgi:hypothetical protein
MAVFIRNLRLRVSGDAARASFEWEYEGGISYSAMGEGVQVTVSLEGNLAKILERVKDAILVYAQGFIDQVEPGVILLKSDIVLLDLDRRSVCDLAISDYAGLDYKDHRTLNYSTGLIGRRLHREPIEEYLGEIRKIRFWESTKKLVPIVEETITYARQSNGLLMMVNPNAEWGDADFYGQRKEIAWYRKDGTLDPETKVLYKVYNAEESMEEGERRRHRVIRSLKSSILGMLAYTETGGDMVEAERMGVEFLSKYRDQISDYYETGHLSWTGKAEHQTPPGAAPPSPNILTDTDTWLDNDLASMGMAGTSIRDFMLNALREIME